jgi:hypothetical protein
MKLTIKSLAISSFIFLSIGIVIYLLGYSIGQTVIGFYIFYSSIGLAFCAYHFSLRYSLWMKDRPLPKTNTMMQWRNKLLAYLLAWPFTYAFLAVGFISIQSYIMLLLLEK